MSVNDMKPGRRDGSRWYQAHLWDSSMFHRCAFLVVFIMGGSLWRLGTMESEGLTTAGAQKLLENTEEMN